LEPNDEALCERVAELTIPRAGAAATCIDESCDSVLVVGGNAGGAPADLIDLSTATPTVTALTTLSYPSLIFAPGLCGSQLVAGGAGVLKAGGLTAVSLGVSTSQELVVESLLTTTPEELTIFPAILARDNGDCWVMGGIDESGEHTDRLRWITAMEVAPNDPNTYLNQPRFGAAAAEVMAGPLGGSVLIGGGVMLDNIQGVAFTRGAEVLRP
jgi:hypothetical protein